MITIPLRITGDTWYNAQDFYNAVSNVSQGQYVLIDVNSEGPSLGIFGIYQTLAQSATSAYIFTRWSNPIESSPYGRVLCSQTSHFFKLSQHYWIDEIENAPAKHVFALFVGRHSAARNVIMWEVYHRYGPAFLLSKMKSGNENIWQDQLPPGAINKDSLSDWVFDPRSAQAIKSWWNNDPIASIDGKTVRDQYGHAELSAAGCVLSLLSYYDQFNFELVCESYTRGTTFFPTEKTIRAIVGNKPFLVYGPQHYLKNLQNLGFRTFSGIWNEQYDCYEGPQRWNSMRGIIDMICGWDDTTRATVLKQCSAITQHNRNRLQELMYDR